MRANTRSPNYVEGKALCYKSMEKFGPNHKCAPTVPLHIIVELLEVCDEAEEVSSLSPNAF